MTTPTPRPHAAMQCQYAMDDSLSKWVWFELRQEWVTADDSWAFHCIYFVGHTKPIAPPKRKVTLGGFTFDAPETVAPAMDAQFYVAAFGFAGLQPLSWCGTDWELEMLALGLVHLNPEAATLHGQGMAAVNLAAVRGEIK
jgi:hypothetical protein